MSEKFEILSEVEHCLKRPGVWVGSVQPESYETFISGEWTSRFYSQGLAKIINEVIDNSVDEFIRTKGKFANQISVKITPNACTVTDNGRGIPQDEIKMPDGKMVQRAVAAWTQLRAGSNFDDSTRIGAGTNGVGAALTNIFSTSFKGITSDGKTQLTVMSKQNMSKTTINQKPTTTNGTSVTFTPEFTRFGCTEFEQHIQDIIENRLGLLQVCYPGITFKFNNKKIQTNTLKKYASMYGDHIICQSNEKVSWFLADSKDHTFRQISAVNGLYNSQGGAHVNWFMNSLCKILAPAIKRKFKVDVPNSAIKNGLILGIFLQEFNSPDFDSQTKERFKSAESKIKSHCDADIDFDKIAKQVLKNEDIINPIVDVFLARKEASELREAAKLAKSNKRVPRVEGHIKAGKAGGYLFLAEGLSAIGYLMNVRDKDLHGGFPLKGKVKNVHGAPLKEIMNNTEYVNIMSCLGLDLSTSNACLELSDKYYNVGNNILNQNDELCVKGVWRKCMEIKERKPTTNIDGYEDQDNTKVRRQTTMYYNEIHIFCDADVDGASIYTGLINFFWRWPDLFDNGRVKIVRSPIIIANNGKKNATDDFFYDLPEWQKNDSKYKSVRYIKGLGSLTEKEYKKCVYDSPRYVISVNASEDFDLLYSKGKVSNTPNSENWPDLRKKWLIE